MGYSFRLAAMGFLYASFHRQDNTYHGLCYISRGALAGTRNSDPTRQSILSNVARLVSVSDEKSSTLQTILQDPDWTDALSELTVGPTSQEVYQLPTLRTAVLRTHTRITSEFCGQHIEKEPPVKIQTVCRDYGKETSKIN